MKYESLLNGPKAARRAFMRHVLVAQLGFLLILAIYSGYIYFTRLVELSNFLTIVGTSVVVSILLLINQTKFYRFSIYGFCFVIDVFCIIGSFNQSGAASRLTATVYLIIPLLVAAIVLNTKQVVYISMTTLGTSAFILFFGTESLELNNEIYMFAFVLLFIGLIIFATYLKDRDIRQLFETQSQLFENSRHALMGQMAAGIGHEIMNPIAIIAGSTSVALLRLSRGELDSEKMVVDLNRIQKTCDRVTEIVSGIRSFVSAKSTQKGRLEIAQLFHETYNICKSTAKANSTDILVDTDAADLENFVWGDRVLLVQALVNLVNNSIAATKNMKNGWIRLSFSGTPDELKINVIDSGLGVAREHRGSIFMPFFATEKKAGAGLGLVIAERIAKDHQGYLRYDQDAENTTFTLVLPRFKG